MRIYIPANAFQQQQVRMQFVSTVFIATGSA